MNIDTDIRQIARDMAREVFKEELRRLELALDARRAGAHPGPERLLSVEEVAKLCNVGSKTVQRWIAKGLLRAMRGPGIRQYRITRRDFEAFASGSPENAASTRGLRPRPSSWSRRRRGRSPRRSHP